VRWPTDRDSPTASLPLPTGIASIWQGGGGVHGRRARAQSNDSAPPALPPFSLCAAWSSSPVGTPSQMEEARRRQGAVANALAFSPVVGDDGIRGE
jgi:hypothetical protein